MHRCGNQFALLSGIGPQGDSRCSEDSVLPLSNCAAPASRTFRHIESVTVDFQRTKRLLFLFNLRLGQYPILTIFSLPGVEGPMACAIPGSAPSKTLPVISVTST